MRRKAVSLSTAPLSVHVQSPHARANVPLHIADLTALQALRCCSAAAWASENTPRHVGRDFACRGHTCGSLLPIPVVQRSMKRGSIHFLVHTPPRYFCSSREQGNPVPARKAHHQQSSAMLPDHVHCLLTFLFCRFHVHFVTRSAMSKVSDQPAACCRSRCATRGVEKISHASCACR